jgi:hypothetical protein
VQIQHTDQGTRLVVPSGQLPGKGFIQIVQTSSGQHVIASSAQASTVATTSTVVNGSTVTTMASSTVKMVSSQAGQMKMSSGQQLVQIPAATLASGQKKPVMRVSPLVDSQKQTNGAGSVFTEATATSATSSVKWTSTKTVPTAISQQLCKYWEDRKKMLKKSQFYLEPLCDQQQKRRLEKLNFIAKVNKHTVK